MRRNDKLSPPWLPNTHTIIKVYERSLLLESKNGKRYVRAKQHVKPFKGINDEKVRPYDDEEDDDDIFIPIPDHDTTIREEDTAVEDEEVTEHEEDDNENEEENNDEDENNDGENEEDEDGERNENIVAGTRTRQPPERISETYSH